jgi:UDP-3-O-[3-hydroxymyristoyl] glucosamine N-acyltransferase
MSAAVTALRDRNHAGTPALQPVPLAVVERLLGCRALRAEAGQTILGATTLDRPAPSYLAFLDRPVRGLQEALQTAAAAGLLLIARPSYATHFPGCLLPVDHPRAGFAACLHALFPGFGGATTIALDPSARIDPSAHLSVGVVVGSDTVIGAQTVVHPNVFIGPRVRIGRRCVLKSGTVVGQSGFGIHRDAHGAPELMPHVGGVVIGDEVLLGALNTVAAGTIHPTIVGDQVKTDDHVHIAHNCVVGPRTLITACAELSGSVSIGEDCWIGPNASIRDGMSLGDRAYVGIGSVVVKDVPADTLVYGCPARPREGRANP